jgi:16S rRNA (cytosine1402-N4)-methyltransferase
MSQYHIPVLLTQAIDGLHVVPEGIYVDATLGGGGHTREIIKRGGFVIGIDTDEESIIENRKQLQINGKKETILIKGIYQTYSYDTCIFCQGNFSNISDIIQTLGFTKVSGILFDLGVSSHQIDTPKRGFSYRFTDEVIDLRLNPNIGFSAEYVLSQYTEEELYEIFSRFAEEERSFELSHAICRARAVKPLHTTGDVLQVIKTVVRNEKDVASVASKIFQALRIEVNSELINLKKGLQGAYEILDTNVYCSVISFHSLEDRIVKQEFRKPIWKRIGKSIYPTMEEQKDNKRSRSATLRIAQKI